MLVGAEQRAFEKIVERIEIRNIRERKTWKLTSTHLTFSCLVLILPSPIHLERSRVPPLHTPVVSKRARSRDTDNSDYLQRNTAEQ